MAPEYLTVDDIMASLQCGKTKAYELIKKIGGAQNVGMARVLKSKFLEYLEGECDSTHERNATARASGGRRGPRTDTHARVQQGAASAPPLDEGRWPMSLLERLERKAGKR